MSLAAFLNPVTAENKEVIVSDRFKEDGKVVPFVIRPITQDENKRLMKKYTKTDKKTGAQVFERMDYIGELTAASVVSPDLTNADLQKAYSVLGAESLLQKMLYAGEYAVLVEAVQNLSGFDADINDDIEEVKNA